MSQWFLKNKVLTLVLVEAAVFLLYASYVFTTYSAREIVFTDNDMQVLDTDWSVSPGTYLDTSYESAKAVVSPVFSLDKGIYYIEAVYRGNGIMKAGLIYDPTRNGKETVDGDEIVLNSQEDSISYRVKINAPSSVRFKIRLTPEAIEGDYAQLLNVKVLSSDLTYVYSISGVGLLLILVDLLLLGYFRYYKALSSKQQTICIILIMAALLTVLPLYQPGLPSSADLKFHLQRIEGVYKGLLSGQLPVRIQPEWLDGNGYAVSVFYGDILLYFPAVLRMIGFTVQETYKVYVGFINIATVFVSFYAFRRMTRDDAAALAGTVLYACCNNRISQLFGGMIGAYSGMLFYPLVIAGFYLIFTEDVKDKAYKKIWPLLAAGFSGLLMSHMISCLMVGVFSLLICLIMVKRVLRRETFTELCRAVFVTILLNLWYLIPFFQYMLTEKLHINSNLAVGVTDQDYYVLLADFTQSGENLYSLFSGQDSIGYALLLLLLFYVITTPIRKKGQYTNSTRVVFVYTIFVIWMCTEYFPIVKLAKHSTMILKCFQTIQYQNRFLSVAAVVAASLGALLVASNMLRKELLYLAAGLLCCINIYQNVQYFSTVSSDVVYLDGVDLSSHIFKGMYDYGIGNGEYLPMATDTERLTRDIQTDETLQIIECNRKYLTYDTNVINETDVPKIILYPILYYGGYRTFDIENGIELETVAGDNGCVEVTVPAGYFGTIHTAFYEPWYWRAAELISLLTFGFLLYLYYGRKYFGINIFMKKAKKGE